MPTANPPFPTFPTGAYLPAFEPVFPYSLPADPFNLAISTFGSRLHWCKSHICPCIATRTDTSPAGSPNPSCTTCEGRGVYWDLPLLFTGLITFGHHQSGAGIEPGMEMDARKGPIMEGQPWVSIPQTAGTVWDQASEMDLVVEIDALTRLNATLQAGPLGIQMAPYQQSLTVPASGAVAVWSQATSSVVQVTGYTVSGSTVLLPASYASGTPYVVEFTAAPVFVMWRGSGGLPHTRPFAGGVIGYPRRFRLQPMDLWLRDSQGNNFGAPGPYASP